MSRRPRKPRAAKAAKPSGPARPAGRDGAPATAGGFELAELRQLIRLVQRTGIGELEVSNGGRSVRIAAHTSMGAVSPAPTAITAPAPAAPSASSSAGAPAAAAEPALSVSSPMVGTFYRAPAPDADPYVEVGQIIEVGQTVCIIEAMKLMNEIESEVRGKVVRVLVENAQPVEFGQKLFLIEPV